MKRYKITMHEFKGLKIERYDGYFRRPFTVSETFSEDSDGWVISSRTSAHLKLLLHQMERMGKAARFDGADRFERIWIIDIPTSTAMGQYYPFRDRGMAEYMVPPLEAARFLLNGEPDLYDLK